MASLSTKKIKLGRRVSAVELASILGGPCGARCMDDDEDLEATVKELLKNFVIYEKLSIQSEIK